MNSISQISHLFEGLQTGSIIWADSHYAGEEYDYDDEEDDDPSSILTNETYDVDEYDDETGCGCSI